MSHHHLLFAISVCLVPSTLWAQADDSNRGVRFRALHTYDEVVLSEGEGGTVRICLPYSGVCGVVSPDDWQDGLSRDPPPGPGGTALWAYNFRDDPGWSVQRLSGEACGETDDCDDLDNGFVVAVKDADGRFLAGRLVHGDEHAGELVAMTPITAPDGTGVIWLHTRSSCGGECYRDRWQATVVDTDQMTLIDVSEPFQTGIEDVDINDAGQWCRHTVRGSPALDLSDGSITLPTELELPDPTTAYVVLTWEGTQHRYVERGRSTRAAPERAIECTAGGE